MTPSEIITKEAQRVGYDADILMRKIHRLVESKVGILLQKNDTLVLLINIAKHIVEIHIFTMDPPNKIPEAFEYFISKIKDSEVKRGYFRAAKGRDSELQKTLVLLKRAGVKVQKSDVPNYEWMVSL